MDVEVGDVAENVGLTSERSRQVNGRFCKNRCWHVGSQSYVVSLVDGLEKNDVKIKLENLMVGMKSDEMSGSDEDGLLTLTPNPGENLNHPWNHAAHGDDEGSSESSA